MTAYTASANHGGVSPPWFTLLATGFCLAIYVTLGAANAHLLYSRSAIDSLEVWRLVTGHLVHTDFEHLAWNVGALLILAATAQVGFGQRWPELFSSLFAAAVSVALTLWVLRPDLQFYCGLSGILNTLLVIVLYEGWKRSRHWIFPAIGVGDALKIATEASLGQALFTSAAWPSVPEAHAAGLLAGGAIIFYRHVRQAR